jgi:hypothetical protein
MTAAPGPSGSVLAVGWGFISAGAMTGLGASDLGSVGGAGAGATAGVEGGGGGSTGSGRKGHRPSHAARKRTARNKGRLFRMGKNGTEKVRDTTGVTLQRRGRRLRAACTSR